MIGFGFCCCGGCEVLGDRNENTLEDFNRDIIASHVVNDEAVPYAPNTSTANRLAWSSPVTLTVNADAAKFADDNLAFQWNIGPARSEFSNYSQSTTSDVDISKIVHTVSYCGKTFTVTFELARNLSAGSTEYYSQPYISRFKTTGFDDNYNITSPGYGDINVVMPEFNQPLVFLNRNNKIYAYIGNGENARMIGKADALSNSANCSVSVHIDGTSFYLAKPWITLYKPDKYWLFPENLSSNLLPTNYEAGDAISTEQYAALTSEEKTKWNRVISGEKERTGCPYPSACNLFVENALPLFKPYYVTFSGFTDKTYVADDYDSSDPVDAYEAYLRHYSMINGVCRSTGVSASGACASIGTVPDLTCLRQTYNKYSKRTSVLKYSQQALVGGVPEGGTIAPTTVPGSSVSQYCGTDSELTFTLSFGSFTATFNANATVLTLQIPCSVTRPTNNTTVSGNFKKEINVSGAKPSVSVLEGAVLTLDSDSDLVDDFGSDAKITVSINKALPVSIRSLYARIRVIGYLPANHESPSYITEVFNSYDANTPYATGYHYQYGVEETGGTNGALVEKLSKKSLVDVTLPLDPVYTDGVFYGTYKNAAYSSNEFDIEDSTVLVGTSTVGSCTSDLPGYKGTNGIHFNYTGPIVNIGTYANVMVTNDHSAMRQVEHVYDGTTYYHVIYYAETNDNGPYTYINGVLSGDTRTYRVRPSNCPSIAQNADYAYCPACEANGQYWHTDRVTGVATAATLSTTFDIFVV